MDITIQPGLLKGSIDMIPSKSMAHRYLICAALSDNPTQLHCPQAGSDVEATADCLKALGAEIIRTDSGFTVFPIKNIPKSAALYCRDSGSTLRFLLPIAGALGVDATFYMEGRLPQRPVSPLWEEMERMGCSLTRPTGCTLRCRGKLQPGKYFLDGSVSSQFVTGLLFALSLLDSSDLIVKGCVESRPYIEMTKAAMALFCAPRYHSPGFVRVEGDWSNAAFFLAAMFLGNEITVMQLDEKSPQGDRKVTELLPKLGNFSEIDVSDIPDLVPILSVVASVNQGARFENIRRLRTKESDRVASTVAMIENLGGRCEVSDNSLTVFGTGLTGGTVDTFRDHRIAMSAAIAATLCSAPITVLGAECVTKSYPLFWSEYSRLGGKYEQYLR